MAELSVPQQPPPSIAPYLRPAGAEEGRPYEPMMVLGGDVLEVFKRNPNPREDIERSHLAERVLDAMLKEMPLLRLYQKWDERKHSIPAYLEKVRAKQDSSTPSYDLHLRAALSAPNTEGEGDLLKAFSQTLQEMHRRIDAELVGLLTQTSTVEVGGHIHMDMPREMVEAMYQGRYRTEATLPE